MENTKKYVVATATGLIVYENDSKRMCNAYLKSALKKGSKPEFLRCLTGKDWKNENRPDKAGQ